MTAKPYKVYVIQGRTARDYSACQTAVATVPAHLETLPFLKNEEEIIERAHDADGLVVSSLRMDNVIVTPHAAYFSTPAVAQVPQRCGEEVARALTGQRPLHVVNPEVYAAGRQLRAT